VKLGMNTMQSEIFPS